MIVTATQPTKILTILSKTSTGCSRSNANNNNNNNNPKNVDNTILATTFLTMLT